MTLRMKQALAGLALTGALIGGGATVAFAQSDGSSSSSGSTSSSDASPGAPQTPPAPGSNANCPNM